MFISSVGVTSYLVYKFSVNNQEKIAYQSDDEQTKQFSQLKFSTGETQQLLKLVNQNYYFDLINFQYMFLNKLKTSYRELLVNQITFETDNALTARVINVKIGGQNELN